MPLVREALPSLPTENVLAEPVGKNTAPCVALAALEIQRRDKVIGSSLEAAPVLEVSDPDLAKILRSVEMDDLCITSALELTEGPISETAFRQETTPVGVVFQKAEGKKCQRCWKILPDVGLPAHPETCTRCASALGS